MAGAMPTAAAVHHNVVHAEAIPLMMFGATIATMPAEDRETAATTKKVLLASQIVCMMVVITFAVSVLEGASFQSGLVQLFLGLLHPACGYFGVKNRDRDLMCAFCGCALFNGVGEMLALLVLVMANQGDWALILLYLFTSTLCVALLLLLLLLLLLMTNSPPWPLRYLYTYTVSNRLYTNAYFTQRHAIDPALAATSMMPQPVVQYGGQPTMMYGQQQVHQGAAATAHYSTGQPMVQGQHHPGFVVAAAPGNVVDSNGHPFVNRPLQGTYPAPQQGTVHTSQGGVKF
jgi:hypothetical protein